MNSILSDDDEESLVLCQGDSDDDEFSQSGSGDEEGLLASFSSSFSSLNASKHSTSSGLTSSKHSLSSLGSSFSSFSKQLKSKLPRKKYSELKEGPPEDVFTIEERASQELTVDLANTSGHSGTTQSDTTAAEHSFAADDNHDIVEHLITPKAKREDFGIICVHSKGRRNDQHLELDITGRSKDQLLSNRKVPVASMETTHHSEPTIIVSPRTAKSFRTQGLTTSPRRTRRNRTSSTALARSFRVRRTTRIDPKSPASPTKAGSAIGSRTWHSPSTTPITPKARTLNLARCKNRRPTNKSNRNRETSNTLNDSKNSSLGSLDASMKSIDLNDQSYKDIGTNTYHVRSSPRRRHADRKVILGRILTPDATPTKTLSPSDNIAPLLISTGIERSSDNLERLTPRFLTQRQRRIDFDPKDLMDEVLKNSPEKKKKKKSKPTAEAKKITAPLLKAPIKSPVNPVSPKKMTNRVFCDPGLPHQDLYL